MPPVRCFAHQSPPDLSNAAVPLPSRHRLSSRLLRGQPYPLRAFPNVPFPMQLLLSPLSDSPPSQSYAAAPFRSSAFVATTDHCRLSCPLRSFRSTTFPLQPFFSRPFLRRPSKVGSAAAVPLQCARVPAYPTRSSAADPILSNARTSSPVLTVPAHCSTPHCTAASPLPRMQDVSFPIPSSAANPNPRSPSRTNPMRPFRIVRAPHLSRRLHCCRSVRLLPFRRLRAPANCCRSFPVLSAAMHVHSFSRQSAAPQSDPDDPGPLQPSRRSDAQLSRLRGTTPSATSCAASSLSPSRPSVQRGLEAPRSAPTRTSCSAPSSSRAAASHRA